MLNLDFLLEEVIQRQKPNPNPDPNPSPNPNPNPNPTPNPNPNQVPAVVHQYNKGAAAKALKRTRFATRYLF